MRQSQALHLLHGGASIFLTGAPGAGKTFVLQAFIEQARQRGKHVAVTASTGIAATHIGGTTIHSWAGMGIRETLSVQDIKRLCANKTLQKRYNSTDILVIDEISMLHGVRLDLVNQLTKSIRSNMQPFGGMQVVFVGDLYQLPPISRANELVDFAHLSDAWNELNPLVCYLTEQHRQGEGDSLLDLLEAMRRNEVSEYHQTIIQERLGESAPDATTITRLFAHNVDVDTINHAHLKSLTTNSHVYNMKSVGTSHRIEQLQKSVLAPQHLELKPGAEVLFVANNFSRGIANGTRGQVVYVDDEGPTVILNDGREVYVEPHTWSFEEDGKLTAEVTQIPLRLAWAITIHKSQGMSLDAAEIDLSRSFTPGMGYVALSRVRSLDGLYLRGINRMAMQLHPLIHDYDVELRRRSERLALNTPDYKHVLDLDPIQNGLNQALASELRQWRSNRATAERKPAYMILHDSTIHELVLRRPKTKQEMSGVGGVGPSKLEKYADDILDILTK